MTISTPASPPTGIDTQHARILVVDDEEANLMVLRRMLERAGYTNLQTISDSTLAVERFVSFEPDLLVLDLHMPTPNGFEVMAQIEPLVGPDSYVPILVLTADITESTRERALAVGARDFLTKPFRYTELLLRINNLLETRALHTQLHRDKSILQARMREQQANDQAQTERRRSASRRIEAVLANDRAGTTEEAGVGLHMLFQPILDLSSGDVLGAEALARFGTEPQRSPSEWFLDAADVGLGVQLELAALRRAAECLPMLPPDAFLSVNASSETIRSPALLATLDGLPASRLVIELTEHERVEDYETLVGPVARLRDRGVRLAVDDTGAGFASLHHILRLNPDLIKLDRVLIHGLAEDPARRALTTALVAFARDIGAILVAEGIADATELESLRDIGVQHGQGHFLGAPTTLPFDSSRFAHMGGPLAGGAGRDW